MASVRWIGAAQAVAQQDTITIANTWGAGDTATVTIGGASIVVTVGATVTTASIATAIAEAINGDAITGDATRSASGADLPQFAEVTASVSGSVVTVTGSTAGVPFTLTASESTAGSGTATRASLVACSGPNFWDVGANWSGGSEPADADDVYIDNSDISILYGLDNSDIEPATLTVAQSFTGTIGLPEVNAGGYDEYRSTYLSLGPAALRVGTGAGTGSGRIKLDLTSDICAATVLNTGSPLDPNLPALVLKGTNASNSLKVLGGSVGVAVFGGESATFATVDLSGGELYTGAGTTLSGALVVSGGAWDVNSLVDGSLTVTGGAVTINGTGAVDQLTVSGGSVTYNTTGTLGGNTVVEGPGALDFGAGLTTVTVSNAVTLRGQNCTVSDVNGRAASVTYALTGGATVAQLQLKPNKTIAVS